MILPFFWWPMLVIWFLGQILASIAIGSKAAYFYFVNCVTWLDLDSRKVCVALGGFFVQAAIALLIWVYVL